MDHAVEPDVRSRKLVATLAMGGAMAGLLIVGVFHVTEPRIKAYKAEVLRQAIQEVLRDPERYDTLFVHDNSLVHELPAGLEPDDLEQVYLGFNGRESVGFAVVSAEPGFQDVVRLIFGYDARENRILGMAVLESKETPGLGDKIEKDSSFVAQFTGAEPPLVGVKRASGDPSEIDMITGATISSRTVIRIIDNALERLGPMLTAYEVNP